MSVYFPNGATLSISSGFAAAKLISAISNANPGVATSAANGFANGDIVLVTSGWEDINERAVRVSNAAAGAFTLEGIDTSNVAFFPDGISGGTAKKVTGWVAVNQVIGNSMSGGEQQYWTYAPLEARRDKQIPTTKNAQAFAFQLADDDSLAWYEELDKADREKEVRILRMSLPNGKTIYYAGYASFNKTPTLVRNEGAAVSFGFTINAEITAYRAPVGAGGGA